MYSKRQEELIRYLSEIKFSKVEQLAEVFQVSAETIRRDLLDLEKDGCIKRVRGGATFNSLCAREVEFEKKLENRQLEKLAIGRAACDLINDGDAIAISNGSTNLALARCLVEKRNNLTIVTNSPDIAGVLNENETNHVFLTSGYLRKHNKSLIGTLCVDCLDKFKVDKCILSIDGISIKDGVTEYNVEEAAVLRKMISISNVRMILCVFGKFRDVALNRVSPAEDIDIVVTDWNVSGREIKEWADIDVKVISAPNA